MGNTISRNDDSISMSNGLTNVFINVLVLSGSRLAKTVDEKRLIVWLAEKDQSKVGMGTVGFDIEEMPWNIDSFEDNKHFMLDVIQSARNKLGWELLEYSPNEKLLFPMLEKFSKMISKLEVKYVLPNALGEWLTAADSDDPVVCGFPKCEKHGVYLSCFGCQVCNN